MSTNDNNVALNNYLQNTGRLASLSWEDKSDGPRHGPVWTSYCKINDVVMGTGTGSQKNAARDAAAGQALLALKAQDAAEEAETAAE
ncbi:hypothetical protein GSI_06215 [Ganoderma sinense ZZ0214-1]|uniref:DRBM domain-containing protein n=1 Tax=Ganoderma sinense ZZ0214-1 TaxID=1077348 RepID=A0A2G8SCP1_9APHY|nr:hypothetical protein GSI_06215 [Ganoderma sinense ZZ0214-1]